MGINARLGLDVGIQVVYLLANLLPSTSKRDAVDVGHNSLLDDLAGNLAVQGFGELISGLHVLGDAFLDKMSDSRVDVSRTLAGLQVDLAGAPSITAQGSIMLKSIAGSILMHWQVRNEFGGIGRIESGFELETGSQALPRILRLAPPHLSCQWVERRVVDILEVLASKGFPIVETGLVVSEDVCQMHLEPAQAALAKLLALRKGQQASYVVGTHVIEIGWNRIRAPSEVDVVGEVESLVPEGLGDLHLEIHVAPDGVKRGLGVLGRFHSPNP